MRGRLAFLVLMAVAVPTVPAWAQAPAIAEGEPEALQQAIQPCWQLPAGAAGVTVQIQLTLDAAGRPVADSITPARGWFPEPMTPPQSVAFAAARRAVLRCGQAGLPVPRALQGRDWPLALTFFPEGGVHAF
jgi:hypothetical protein